MKILVTGFKPYGRYRRNPSERLARESGRLRLGGARVVARVLPTEYKGCEAELRRAIRTIRPDAIVMFGLAPERRKITIEALALNVDHSERPDNAGVRPWRRTIDRKGPALLETTLPVDKMYAALRRARVPVTVSYHAGTYVCNHAFYTAARLAPRVKVGFIHVPKNESPARLRRAMEVIVGEVCREISR
ncbi:MAG: pyroglutamyl-peptidase I [Planctomycetes bacterium]|nr:pyroglutamyl-peptidase I [Planctomycetota bacterium]